MTLWKKTQNNFQQGATRQNGQSAQESGTPPDGIQCARRRKAMGQPGILQMNVNVELLADLYTINHLVIEGILLHHKELLLMGHNGIYLRIFEIVAAKCLSKTRSSCSIRILTGKRRSHDHDCHHEGSYTRLAALRCRQTQEQEHQTVLGTST